MFRAAWEAWDGAASSDELGAAHELLDAAMGDLAGDELDVVGLVVERLRLGRNMYGQLNIEKDKRDFGQEALEEAVDGFVYVGTRLLKVRRIDRSGFEVVR